MRLFAIILFSLTSTLNGWTGGVSSTHIEEQCHVVEGEHHEEALADHEKEHHATPGHEKHDSEKDCEPEHCSDHCNLCHASNPGLANGSSDDSSKRTPRLDVFSSGDLKEPASFSLSPDTPPPKA